MKKSKSLWTILVPRFSNEGEEFDLQFHKLWDEKVKEISGGLTILRTAKGSWIDTDKKDFSEEMIPVMIRCTKKEIKKITNYTINYYNQKAIFYYLQSKKTYILKR